MSLPRQFLRPLQRLRWPLASIPCQTRRLSTAELRYGQPLYETHPHLLKPGEVTPGISALEYHQRRVKLAKALPADTIAVFAGNEIKQRSGGAFYKFHQDPDFFYLTGFNEPGALAIIEKIDDDDLNFHLYVRSKNPKAELWEGARSGIEAATEVFNADTTGDIAKLPELLPTVLNRARKIYVDLAASRISENVLATYLRAGGLGAFFQRAAVPISSVRPLMNELRAIKSEAEVINMRKAGQLSGRAITDAMRQDFAFEKDLDSFLGYWFRQDGCDGPAYIPVVAGGTNANTIHYVTNDMPLKPGELVLVDAGAEYAGYVTDISRTWPINGKFTPAQKDLYQVLLNVQRSCVSLCHADSNMSLDRLHRLASNTLKDGLKSLGLDMSGDAIDTLFPHHVGHYVGLDVHDCTQLSRSRDFEKGMCITVEPGIYVPDDENWPSWARGINMRIEDSVCIGDDSPLVLSTEAVKEVDDIEALKGTESKTN